MIRLIEIFRSIQGESSYSGLPFAFVRLAVCNLRCVYCDTTYSFGQGEARSIAKIVDTVQEMGVRHVCVTGGEPMLQGEKTIALMREFLSRQYTVLLETNGSIPLDDVPDEVVKIMDVKTPAGLGWAADDPRFKKTHFHPDNLALLTDRDEVKFVVSNRQDYEWARQFIATHELSTRCGQILMSPSWDVLDAAELVAWMLEDQLPARLNLQIHKHIWDPSTPGV